MNNVLDVLNDDENIDIIVHEVQVATGGDKVSIYRGHGPDIFCQFRARATKPYMVVISPSFPQGDREVTEAVYNQLTEGGIPTVYGLQGCGPCVTAVCRLPPIPERLNLCIGETLIGARVQKFERVR